MEPSNDNLATMMTAAGRLLADHADAPRIAIATGRIMLDLDTLCDRATVDFQLANKAPREEIREAALWAERLGAQVVFTFTGSDVRVHAAADLDGVRVEVWNRLTPAELLAVLPAELAARCLVGAVIAPAEVLSALAA
jgi:hypothetical protein